MGYWNKHVTKGDKRGLFLCNGCKLGIVDRIKGDLVELRLTSVSTEIKRNTEYLIQNTEKGHAVLFITQVFI